MRTINMAASSIALAADINFEIEPNCLAKADSGEIILVSNINHELKSFSGVVVGCGELGKYYAKQPQDTLKRWFGTVTINS
jgi:hypothetical protein